MLVFPSSRRHKNCVFCQFLDDLPPPNPAYITSLRISWAQWQQEALQAARETLERALVLLEKHSSAETVRVLVNLSTLLVIYMGQQTEGSAYAEQAQAMAEHLGDNSLKAATSRAVAGKLSVSSDTTLDALLLTGASTRACRSQ